MKKIELEKKEPEEKKKKLKKFHFPEKGVTIEAENQKEALEKIKK